MARPGKVSIRVAANTQGATKGLTGVAKSILNLGEANKKLRRGLGRSGLLPAAMGFGGVAGVGAAAIKSSFDFEYIKLRLEAVYGSAKKANSVFEETFELFRKSPLMLEPLVKARILLQSIGQGGMGALRSVAQAAVAMGKDIVEVSQAVASMELEPLRKMGLEIRRVQDKGVITFMDRMGKKVKVVGNSVDELRQQLMKAFNVKFGGFLGKASKTGVGLWSTLVGNAKVALGRLGDPFREMVKSQLKHGIEFLDDGDMFEIMGQNLYDTIRDYINKLKSTFKVDGLIATIKSALSPIDDMFGAINKDLVIIAKNFGKILGVEMGNAMSGIARTVYANFLMDKKGLSPKEAKGMAYARYGDTVGADLEPVTNVTGLVKKWGEKLDPTGKVLKKWFKFEVLNKRGYMGIDSPDGSSTRKVIPEVSIGRLIGQGTVTRGADTPMGRADSAMRGGDKVIYVELGSKSTDEIARKLAAKEATGRTKELRELARLLNSGVVAQPN